MWPRVLKSQWKSRWWWCSDRDGIDNINWYNDYESNDKNYLENDVDEDDCNSKIKDSLIIENNNDIHVKYY